MSMKETLEQAETEWQPFPYDQFPDPVREYIRQSAQSLHCDPSMIGVPILSVLATAIGNSVVLQAKRGWREPAVIWTTIIAPSGSMKSPAARHATCFVQQRHQEKTEQYKRALRDYDNAFIVWETENPKGSKKKKEPKPIEPTHERCLVNDTTIEALIEILAVNLRGVLCYRDELAAFFDSFGQYKAKGSADVPTYLSMFNAEAISNDRKVNGAMRFIPRAAVSITGTIQPDILRKRLAGENTENGMAARFLFCEPPINPKCWSDDEVEETLTEEMENLFRLLFEIPCGEKPTICYLSKPARARFVQFVNQHGIETANVKGAIAAAYSKLEAYCLRFALIFHLIDLVEGRAENVESRVQLENLERAIQLVEWFKWQTQRVYQSLQGFDPDVIELVKLIGDQFRGEITSEELRKAKSKYRGSGAAQDALDELQRRKLGRFFQVPTEGRPKNVFRLKNC
ncbi:YfjI family protein [Thalassoglobus polymorphus]|uniref:DUF3987 domain-containing protein n=1 Tax=Thalassoglobus polymorphus TaxID=2527994 RepID=A0A517QT55_9PLAN|nr:YfjI family protein [Thalassoglobus polymorphus]QDT34824.1 hypothetical protein Mal48_40960 [Thalassoglobus polymorphus]